LIVSIVNQTIALCIDARLSGDMTLSTSRQIFQKSIFLINLFP